MEAPSSKLRYHVADASSGLRTDDLPDADVEAHLDDLLERVESEMASAIDAGRYVGLSPEEAEDQLAVVDAWAGLISAAVGRVYAPASPWPRHSAGWGKKIVRRLRRMALRLQAVLKPVSQALGAIGFSISVGFPWGISIGLSF